MTFHDGRYHAFFQHVPDRTTWDARCHWGHATSEDLLRWVEQPVALEPAADELGAWSGCLVPLPDGDAVVLYTSVVGPDVERGRVRLARPDDTGWQRWVPGPVVLEPPEDTVASSFRDPFVLPAGDGWRMVVGARLVDGTAAALLYGSDDLLHWRPLGSLAGRHTDERVPVWTGSMWECPQLLEVGSTRLLVVSGCAEDGLLDVAAATGDLVDDRFEVREWRRLTAGVPYAASTFRDTDGAPVLLAWLRDVAAPEDGWSGALSLPMVLEVEAGAPALAVHPAVAARRREAREVEVTLDAEWRATAGEVLELRSRSGTLARLSLGASVLEVVAGGRAAELPAGDGAVRVVVDGPVLEVVAGGMLGALPLVGNDGVVPVAGSGDLSWWALR